MPSAQLIQPGVGRCSFWTCYALTSTISPVGSQISILNTATGKQREANCISNMTTNISKKGLNNGNGNYHPLHPPATQDTNQRFADCIRINGQTISFTRLSFALTDKWFRWINLRSWLQLLRSRDVCVTVDNVDTWDVDAIKDSVKISDVDAIEDDVEITDVDATAVDMESRDVGVTADSLEPREVSVTGKCAGA